MNDLTIIEIQALHDALDDEYKAWATYNQVIADFGEVRPFINIRDTEGRHIEALKRLFVRYALVIPENPWPANVTQFGSLQEACAAGVSDEIDNAKLYERLFKSTERPDILTVLHNLHDASQERHLPAFQRCVAGRGAGGGCGKGQQHRRQGRA
jgi:hypothetical protein